MNFKSLLMKQWMCTGKAWCCKLHQYLGTWNSTNKFWVNDQLDAQLRYIRRLLL